MTVTPDTLYNKITHRSEMVLGRAVMERLSVIRVVIFGLGGVGSWCAEGLVRTGLINLTIVDPDVICPTNINRQVQATALNIGKPKAEELRDRLVAIQPAARIEAVRASFDEATAAGFRLGFYDYAVDAIDRLADKALLLARCAAEGVTVFSSMGAAARTEPSRIRTGPVARTSGCPMARRVRKMLRERGVTADITCVYSDEPPSYRAGGGGEDNGCGGSTGEGKRVNGSLVHVTALFGFMLAGLVIGDVAKKCAG